MLRDDWATLNLPKKQMLDELPASDAALALASVGPFECPAKDSPKEHESDGLVYRCGDSGGGSGSGGSGSGGSGSGGSGGGGGRGLCIHAQQACNGIAECADGSDERRSACRAVAVKSQPCITTSGQDPLRPCILPFVYRGQTFAACALDDAIDGKAWCPTAVSSSGAYTSFRSWGACGPGCEREDTRRLLEDGCTPHPVGYPPPNGSVAADEGLPLHCAPPPSPPPEPPAPPPPPMAPPLAPPWALATSPHLAVFGGVLLLIACLGSSASSAGLIGGRATLAAKALSSAGSSRGVRRRDRDRGRRAVPTDEEVDAVEIESNSARARAREVDELLPQQHK